MGVTYKADVNDIRESPALEIIEMLERKGAQRVLRGPLHARSSRSTGSSSPRSSPTPEAVAAADCVLILTNHSSFDYAAIAERAALVVDTRNALKAHRKGRSSIVTL